MIQTDFGIIAFPVVDIATVALAAIDIIRRFCYGGRGAVACHLAADAVVVTRTPVLGRAVMAGAQIVDRP